MRPMRPAGRAGAGPAVLEVEEPEGAQHIAQAGAEKASAAGLDATAHTAHGDIMDCICDASGSLHAELLVVGTRGHGPLSGTLLGSVSHALIKRSQIPVTIVGHALVHAARACGAGREGSPGASLLGRMRVEDAIAHVLHREGVAIAPCYGLAMGFKLARPERDVVHVLGDAALGMVAASRDRRARRHRHRHGAARQRAHGGLRGHDATCGGALRHGGPGRDFAASARALGVESERVERPGGSRRHWSARSRMARRDGPLSSRCTRRGVGALHVLVTGSKPPTHSPMLGLCRSSRTPIWRAAALRQRPDDAGRDPEGGQAAAWSCRSLRALADTGADGQPARSMHDA